MGRKELKQLCLDLLRCVDMKTIRHVVELYFMLQTSLHDSISKISELINDLLNPPFQDDVPEENEITGDVSLKGASERHSESISDPNIRFKVQKKCSQCIFVGRLEKVICNSYPCSCRKFLKTF